RRRRREHAQHGRRHVLGPRAARRGREDRASARHGHTPRRRADLERRGRDRRHREGARRRVRLGQRVPVKGPRYAGRLAGRRLARAGQSVPSVSQDVRRWHAASRRARGSRPSRARASSRAARRGSRECEGARRGARRGTRHPHRPHEGPDQHRDDRFRARDRACGRRARARERRPARRDRPPARTCRHPPRYRSRRRRVRGAGDQRDRREALAMRAWYLALCLACSAPATLPELVKAEKAADRGDVDGAVRAYREAQTGCKRLRPERRAKSACSEALLGEAVVLEHAGRTPAAIRTYIAIPSRTDNEMTAATASYRAGTLLLEAGKEVEAWTALWRVVTDWPDEPLAADALKTIVADGRTR